MNGNTGSAMAAPAKISDIVMMNGAELSAAIKAKRLSCAEVMSAYLDHIAAFNPKVVSRLRPCRLCGVRNAVLYVF